ncbi:hypothetical protein RUM44_000879 [Polyplax serrata]|uniref:Uncharacterized protein n=1 Tax=Polyplax serrata TaxID=468196 RepID=A0ABR1B9J3_POLSC
MSSSSFVNIDNSLNPGEVKQNQVFFNRKERFIKFDTKDNELDIELGISIPFIKVPLLTGRQLLENEHPSEISVNAPGVVIAGMLMLTSFVLIPFLFTTQSLPEDSFGFQRRAEDGSSIWTILKNLDDTLTKSGINSSSCVRKSICWLAKGSDGGKNGSLHEWIHYIVNTWWFKYLIGGGIEKTDSDKSCQAAQYAECRLTQQNLMHFMEIVNGPKSQ